MLAWAVPRQASSITEPLSDTLTLVFPSRYFNSASVSTYSWQRRLKENLDSVLNSHALSRRITFDITPEKEASKLQFLRRRFRGGPLPVSRRNVDLAGKTTFVTGANGDIGLECSLQLLELGLTKLTLVVPSYESVVAVAKRAEKLSPRLEIAILNAGVTRASFSLNQNTSHEEDIQTNYLYGVLLMELFLGVFKKTASIVGSSQLSPGCIVLLTEARVVYRCEGIIPKSVCRAQVHS
ncbi:hypothetical protein GGS21DRAFT_492426 [Xylaria nigripes]|nr:hypothetical protein GGS21DRAFT_492426 [Xylaria nigripes]